MKTCLALLAAAFAAGTAFAQQPSSEGVAQLKGVKGNVLLSRDAGLAAAGDAARIMNHTRVITTVHSEAVVVYDNGCEVRLKENQRVEIDSTKTCAALLASVESILVQPASLVVAGGSGAAGFWSVVPAVGGVAIGVEILKPSPAPTPLSPS